MKKQKPVVSSGGLMTPEEYYSRHENDGTVEVATFSFVAVIVILILAAIFG